DGRSIARRSAPAMRARRLPLRRAVDRMRAAARVVVLPATQAPPPGRAARPIRRPRAARPVAAAGSPNARRQAAARGVSPPPPSPRRSDAPLERAQEGDEIVSLLRAELDAEALVVKRHDRREVLRRPVVEVRRA